MADKSVGELIAAQSVTPTDLFVLEQNGTAKKLTGQTLENWLVSFADGHGGIQSIQKVSTSGLTDTYRITLADTTTFDFVVTNGKSVENIKKTGTSGLVDTYTIYYTGGLTSTFTVTNGAKGDKGDNQYVWIKYASQKPTASSHSFGDVADNWIGIYSGASATAPTDWTQYEWFQIKGEKGDTGAAATLTSSTVEYQVSDSGTITPSGAWSASVPVVAQGKYMWTRTTNSFNTGNPVVSYSVSRMGIDGSGSVSSVAGISPNSEGNVPLKAEDVGAVPSIGGEMTGELKMNGQPISGLNAPTSNDQAANKGYTDKEIADRVIYGKGKNLLKIKDEIQTRNGVTFTVNADGSITVNGTATSDIYIAVGQATLYVGGNYILTGNGSSEYSLGLYVDSSDVTGATWQRETPAHFSATATGEFSVNIYVATGYTVSNLTFYPMIRLASETDDTYEPYYKGLAELTDRGMELRWNNASPTSEFPGQTVSVNLSDGEYALIGFKGHCATNVTGYKLCKVGTVAELHRPILQDQYYKFIIADRTATISADSVKFSNASAVNSVDAPSTNNSFLVPVEIYIVKGVSA